MMGKYTQFYSLHTVKNKMFDGNVPLEDLLKYGDFGIGTFNNINGELIAVNGEIYRTKADGGAERVLDLSEKTPYSIMAEFKPQIEIEVKNMGLEEVQAKLDTVLDNKSTIYAVALNGQFQWIRTRAPQPSYPPYKSLADIIADQPSSTFNNIGGDIVGFYTPEFLGALGVPGYHLHFIDAARQVGGHLQDAHVQSATVQLQALTEISIHNPGGDVAA